MAKVEWSVSNIENPLHFCQLEFQDNKGEWHNFDLYIMPDRVVFGGHTNNCYLESGYMLREEFERDDQALQELMGELETYYNDGPQYAPRLICNERM